MADRFTVGFVAAVLVAATVAAGASSIRVPREQPRADDYRVNAAFLYNFAKFVEWPAQAFATPSAPLTLCVLGVDPFGAVLDDTLRGQLVAGRTISVRRLAQVEPGCHLLFIGGSERNRLSLLTGQLRRASVLTVSEEPGFNESGGMIELFTDRDGVQFNISPKAVERSGLRASARLIALAANQRHPSGGRR